MSESFLNGRVILHRGDCLDVLPTLEENSVDSCVCDPPYHLTSIVKRFGAPDAAPCQVGKTGAYARASKGFMGKHDAYRECRAYGEWFNVSPEEVFELLRDELGKRIPDFQNMSELQQLMALRGVSNASPSHN